MGISNCLPAYALDSRSVLPRLLRRPHWLHFLRWRWLANALYLPGTDDLRVAWFVHFLISITSVVLVVLSAGYLPHPIRVITGFTLT